jgi:hypothetical protein
MYGWFTTICCIDVPCKLGLTVTTNRGKPTIYAVKPALKSTSIQQIVVNQPYIQSNLP